MLYPRPILNKLLKTKPALNQAVWQALNQIPVAALVGAGKRVGRLRTSWREHLAQHFGITYTRIALPEPYATQP